MAQNPQNVIVSGGFRIWSAPVGTPLPTKGLVPAIGGSPEVTNLDSGFTEAGFTSPEGSLFRVQFTRGGIPVHQAEGDVRITKADFLNQVQTVFREWNEETMKLAFGLGTFTTSGGWTKFEPPEAGVVDEFSIVMDAVDGTKGLRLVLPRATLSSGVETNFAKVDAMDLPVTFDALVPGGGVKPFYWLVPDSVASA